MSSRNIAANLVTKAEYASAERFLSWNKEAYVINADIQHHWIAGEDRFWYVRTNEGGQKEFVVVDASSGERATAFDHGKLADALAQATGERVEAGNLPFSTIRFSRGLRVIEFKFGGGWWSYQLETLDLRRAEESVAPHEVRSPDGSWVAFVKEENVWIRPAAGGDCFALTVDGIEHYGYGSPPSTCLCVISDRRKGKPIRPEIMWSPDSRHVLTYRVDERRVEDMFLIQSVPEDGSFRPKLYTYRYPMAGDEHVSLLEFVVLNVAARRRTNIATTPMVATVPPIEMRWAWWSADGRIVYFLERDRFAKWIALKEMVVDVGSVREIIRETSDTVALVNAINVYGYPVVRTLANGDVIWYSRGDGWGHLYYYDSSGSLRDRITQGEWIVREIVHVDEAARCLYFSASGREAGRDPYERRLYRIGFDGANLELLTPEEAEHDFWPPRDTGDTDEPLPSEAERQRFSPSGRYFVDSYSRTDVPPVFVLRDCDGRLIRKLEEADISKLRAGGYVAVEPFRVIAADGKTPIYGNLFRPSHFDPTRKYPVIDANYPGPQAVRTSKSFVTAVFDWEEAQCMAELGFMVVTIDGRGTPLRCASFSDYEFGRLDRASDLEDHMAGIRQLAERYPCMDLNRVGIYGISGGGCRAAQAILRHPEFYKVAAASEGNHDQRCYTSIWGESYIGAVESNDYSTAATWQDAANLSGKLLLMHGELDDNVAPALTMRLVDALIKANKDFDLLILPNESHVTAFKSTYFIRRKWDFFVRHLLGAQPPAGYSIAPPPNQVTQ